MNEREDEDDDYDEEVQGTDEEDEAVEGIDEEESDDDAEVNGTEESSDEKERTSPNEREPLKEGKELPGQPAVYFLEEDDDVSSYLFSSEEEQTQEHESEGEEGGEAASDVLPWTMRRRESKTTATTTTTTTTTSTPPKNDIEGDVDMAGTQLYEAGHSLEEESINATQLYTADDLEQESCDDIAKALQHVVETQLNLKATGKNIVREFTICNCVNIFIF